MDRLHIKLVTLMAVLVMTVTFVTVVSDSEETDAVTDLGTLRYLDDNESTAQSAYSSVDLSWSTNSFNGNNTVYILLGASISIAVHDNYTAISNNIDGLTTSPFGASYTVISGTVSDTGTLLIRKIVGTESLGTTTFIVVAPYEFTLSFNANGGSNAPDSIEYSGTSSSHTFTIPDDEPTREDRTFLGWATSSTATTARYQPGSTITISADTTLYAVWQNELLIGYAAWRSSWDPSDGEFSPGSDPYYVLIETWTGVGESHTFTITSKVPEHEGSGWTVAGWANTTTANNPSYEAGDRVTLTSNLILYPVWRHTVTITFDANGGTGAPQSVTGTSTQGNNSNYRVYLDIPDTEPTRSGWTFLGWSTSSTATSPNASMEPGDRYGYTGDSGSLTLYAVWEHTITLTFNANSGSGAPSSLTYTGTEESHRFSIPLTRPTRSGWTFLGWGTTSTGSSAQYDPGDSITLSSSDTLYAKWSKTIRLYYDANGGSGAPGSQSYTIYSGTTSHTFTISSTEPTWAGHEFLGWSTSSTASTASYQPGGTITISNTDYLYAVWRVSTFTITFDSQGGSPVDPMKVNAGAVATAPSEPTLEYFIFKGWYTSTSFTTEYTFSQPVNSDFTLYAKWEGTLAFTSSPVADAQIFSIDGRTYAFSAAQSVGNMTVIWDFGDGAVANGTYASHTYGAPGEYTVTLTVYNSYGSDTITQDIVVTDEGGGGNDLLFYALGVIAVIIIGGLVVRRLF